MASTNPLWTVREQVERDEGQLILTIDGVRTTYGPGQWYHVPATVDHAADFEVDSAEIEFWFEP